MRLSEYKNKLSVYVDVLVVNTINSWQIDTAYFMTKWLKVVLFMVYNVSLIIFVSVLFTKVDSIAGYSRNEMFFLIFMGQVAHCTARLWDMGNILSMITDVNRGDLDLVLAKPLPSLFYVTFKNISVIDFLKEGVPTIAIFAQLVNWRTLAIIPVNLFAGFIVLFMGQVIFHVFEFAFALSVFWIGESREVFYFSRNFTEQDIPFEGYPNFLKAIFTTIIPIAITGGLSSSVTLGKTPALQSLAILAVILLFAVLIKVKLWNMALRHYTSASS